MIIEAGNFEAADRQGVNKRWRVRIMVDPRSVQVARMVYKAARNKKWQSQLGHGLVTVMVTPI